MKFAIIFLAAKFKSVEHQKIPRQSRGEEGVMTNETLAKRKAPCNRWRGAECKTEGVV